MGKCCFLRNLNNKRTVKSILLVKKLLGLLEMMTGLVNACFSLPERQAVKVIFIAPCDGNRRSGREGVVSYTALFFVFTLQESRNKHCCVRDYRGILISVSL